MRPITKAEKREIRQQIEAASPQHEWEERDSPMFVFYRCTICGWKVRLRKGAKHNGYVVSKDDLRNFLPVLDDRGRSCDEKLVIKVMEF